MEMLVVLVGEVLLAVMIPVIGIVGGAVGLLTDLVLALFGTAALHRKARSRPAPTVRRSRRGRRALRFGLTGLILFALVGLEIVNRFYFAPTLRWVAELAASRAGYTIDIGHVDGDLWRGTLRLERLQLHGQTQDGSSAEVTAERVDLDVVISSLLWGTVRLNHLNARDLNVFVHRAKMAEPSRSGGKGRSFAVDDLTIVNAVMVVEIDGRARHTLRITEARTQPLRSRWAAFDLLFRSNLDATLDGTALTVRTRATDGNGRQTEWALDQLELSSLAAFTDAVPIRWFNGGTVSARMEDSWRLDDLTIDSAWEIRLRDAQVAVPEDARMEEQLVVAAFAGAAGERGGDMDLAFRLQLDDDGFRDSASADLSAWWAAMMRGLAVAVAAAEGLNAGEVVDRIRSNTQKLRDLIDIQRQ